MNCYKLLYCLTIVCLAKSQQLPEYAQCNGDNWSGPVQCKPGLKCQRKDRWYSQCLKSCPSGWECNHNELNLVAEHGQCGGVNYKGPTKCASGLTCFKYNKWYSQCLQKCPCGWECCEKTTTFLPSTITTSTKTTTTTIKPVILPSNQPFPNCFFRYGRNYRHDYFDYSSYDYISLWLGQINPSCPASNSRNKTCTDLDVKEDRNEIQMINKANAFGKMIVFKSFIIGFEARNFYGLLDCDYDFTEKPTLCTHGSKFIKENRKFILDKYDHFTSKLNPYLASSNVLFLIEPDFWIYYGEKSQIDGPLSGIEMRKLFDDISEIIKKNLPHVMISWDANMWLNENDMKEWWSYFKDSKYIDFIHTTSFNSRNSLSFKFLNDLTGKLIIVESGDQDMHNQNKWFEEKFVGKKVQEGVIAYGFKDPQQRPFYKGNLCKK